MIHIMPYILCPHEQEAYNTFLFLIIISAFFILDTD